MAPKVEAILTTRACACAFSPWQQFPGQFHWCDTVKIHDLFDIPILEFLEHAKLANAGIVDQPR